VALTMLDLPIHRKPTVKVATLPNNCSNCGRFTCSSVHQRLLAAAAILHDIGYFISHTNHNKHSAYLIQNSELTGL
jgi:exopolyphosphatase/guanosine-5'-triphosphate,3'-diphosphate pyrophosphatase